MIRAPDRILLVLCCAAALCGDAWAADSPKDKGTAGGGPVAPPTSDTNAGVDVTVTGRTAGAAEDEPAGMFDAVHGRRRKWFDVSASWEMHGLLWCLGYNSCSSDAGRSKFLNFGSASAGVNFTRNDRLRLSAGMYIFALADEAESHVRAVDLSLSYAHIFRLPAHFNIRTGLALTAPISFYSQKASLYTAPSGRITVSNSGGHTGLSAELSGFAQGYLQKCSSVGQADYDCRFPGGAPNPQAVAGGSLEVAYAFWFHKALVLGADGYVAWLWFRDVNQGAPMIYGSPDYGYGPGNTPGAVTDTQFPHQPVQQAYGFEAYLRYSLPPLKGLRTDLQFAVAEGDPTLGYVSRNIDGVAHFFGDYFANFEVYGAVAARY